MLAQVRRTLRSRALLSEGERVLIACSGGPDSVALAHVLTHLAASFGVRLAIASVDHQLRADAATDVEVARRLAENLGHPFEVLKVAVDRGSPSLQAQARAARYRALLAYAGTIGAGRVAVGHTLDDQAETVLARLLRGASLGGLAGIAPRREDGVIRPLIDCTRAQVMAHVQRFGLPYVTDPSNHDPRFLRARVRHDLLPRLLQEDPALCTHLHRVADEARELMSWAEGQAKARLGDRPSMRIDRRTLLEGPAPVRTAAIAQWIHATTGQRPKQAHLRAVEALREGGEVLLGQGWLVRAQAQSWAIEHRPEPATRSRRSRADRGT